MVGLAGLCGLGGSSGSGGGGGGAQVVVLPVVVISGRFWEVPTASNRVAQCPGAWLRCDERSAEVLNFRAASRAFPDWAQRGST